MEWWVLEEIEKYKGKQVLFNNKEYIVREVIWDESSEEFVYFIEGNRNQYYKVFEHNIKLIKRKGEM